MTIQPRSRKAWITLLTNPDYLAGVLAVHRTLVSVSHYPLLIMATTSLPGWARDILHNIGLTIIDVPHLSPAAGQHPGFDAHFARFNDAWTKLRVFGLTGYERLILIDSDMIFLRGMDELFDMELPGRDWIAAAPACICNPFKIADYPKDWVPANCSLNKQTKPTTLYSPPIPTPDAPRTSHLLNSGLVVLHPDSETMDHIIHFLNTSPVVATARFADQDIIAEAFKGRWRPLPWWANALKPARAVHTNIWEDQEVRLIHYILDKPWSKPPPAFARSIPAMKASRPTSKEGLRPLPPRLVEMVGRTPAQTSLTDYEGVHSWWWAVYDEAIEELRVQGDDRGWKEVDATVAH